MQTLERLRAERKAKIDELKDRTNSDPGAYSGKQQSIPMYTNSDVHVRDISFFVVFPRTLMWM